MDLVGEMLLAGLAKLGDTVTARRVQPAWRSRFGRVPFLGRARAAFNADRLCNRLWDYPRHVARLREDFDAFHVVDHSYAALVHQLPAERTGVFCHDLDAFRCLLEPEKEPRPRWFRAMARRILKGVQKAVIVFYSTQAVRQQMERHGLIDPARLVHAPYGTAPEFVPQPVEPDPAAALLEPLHGAPFLLHIGSCIPRKRIDVLLAVFAEARRALPALRLVQIGGEWTPAQGEQIMHQALDGWVSQHRGLSRLVLASLYRQAALVLQPSEAEGFGLPVIEALACGAPVLASDIPVLREVGGDAVVYCPVGDVASWGRMTAYLLAEPANAPARPDRLCQASRWSWTRHAQTIWSAYERLLQQGKP